MHRPFEGVARFHNRPAALRIVVEQHVAEREPRLDVFRVRRQCRAVESLRLVCSPAQPRALRVEQQAVVRPKTLAISPGLRRRLASEFVVCRRGRRGREPEPREGEARILGRRILVGFECLEIAPRAEIALAAQVGLERRERLRGARRQLRQPQPRSALLAAQQLTRQRIHHVEQSRLTAARGLRAARGRRAVVVQRRRNADASARMHNAPQEISPSTQRSRRGAPGVRVERLPAIMPAAHEVPEQRARIHGAQVPCEIECGREQVHHPLAQIHEVAVATHREGQYGNHRR